MPPPKKDDVTVADGAWWLLVGPDLGGAVAFGRSRPRRTPHRQTALPWPCFYLALGKRRHIVMLCMAKASQSRPLPLCSARGCVLRDVSKPPHTHTAAQLDVDRRGKTRRLGNPSKRACGNRVTDMVQFMSKGSVSRKPNTGAGEKTAIGTARTQGTSSLPQHCAFVLGGSGSWC